MQDSEEYSHKSKCPFGHTGQVSSWDSKPVICQKEKWKLGSLQVNSQASKGDDFEQRVCFATESQDKSHLYGLGLTWLGPVVSSVIQRFFMCLWANNFIARYLSFPPKGIKDPPRKNEGNFLRQCEGLHLKHASPLPSVVMTPQTWQSCFPCCSSARGGRAFPASLHIQVIVMFSSLHLSSRSGHSWLHLRTTLMEL